MFSGTRQPGQSPKEGRGANDKGKNKEDGTTSPTDQVQTKNEDEFEKTVLKDVNGNDLRCGQASAVTVTDWDGDGDSDLIVGNIEGKLNLITNVGKRKQPRFAKPQPLMANGQAALVPGGDAGPFAADWDLDGRKDLIVGSGNGAIYMFRNVGTNKKPSLLGAVPLVNPHTLGQKADERVLGMRTKVCVNDWNEDGLPDLLVGDFVIDRPAYHGYVWLFLRKEIEKQTARSPSTVTASD